VAGTIKIGRLLGFEVNVHWSWVFIFFLVTWTFSAGILPEFYPEWTDSRRWVVGSAISLVFFFSILLHEMSHSVVARRYGIPVSSITLFVFGGVSNLTKEPENARQEFWIAIVGPLTSLVLAAMFAGLFFLLEPIEDGAAGVALYLAFINTAIGIFNLVPGFPLDGGRVLRSVFWARKRNILAATRLASRGGQIVAYMIMGLGVAVVLLFGQFITGIWFFLIGNFLRTASAASYEQLFVETVLKGIPASRVARADFVALSPEVTVAELVEDHILAGRGRGFPVLAGEELLGMITLTDTRNIPRDLWPTTTVYRAMTPVSKLKTVGLDSELTEVLALMTREDINQVPLMDGRLLRGLIHRSDLLHYIQMRHELSAGAG
jgi:Zn-dependent protease/CBS domain-containing protein